MKRFEKDTILVTGAASGIGYATAKRLDQEGARLVLVDWNLAKLETVRSELEERSHLVQQCDLTNEAAIDKMAEHLRDEKVEFTGVVHCAGIHWLRPLQVTDNKSLMEMLQSHVGSSIGLSRAVVTKRLLSKEHCSIIWFSSAAAFRGGPSTVAYAAAKGALVSACRVLAAELAKRKVRINVIAPGVVRTPQSAAFMSNLTPEQVRQVEGSHLLGIGEPEDISGVVAFLLSEDARWITGTTIAVDGGFTAT